MATIPAAGHISNAARTQTEVKADLDDTIACLRQVPGSAQTPLSVTIATGSITPAGSGGFLTVDTEASAATDDLTNIVTTNYPDGSCLLVRNNNAARFVVLKHAAGGAGQLNLDRSVDYSLDDTKKWILIQRRGADWYEIFRGPRRLTSLTVSQSSNFTVANEDGGKTFLCSNTITANLLAASSAGNGFVITIKNVGTGTITIDGSGSETIDGNTTSTLPIGWSARIACDGSNWSTLASTGPQPSINPIINGNMEIWQHGTSFAAAANAQYSADRFAIGTGSAAVITIGRSTNVPTVAQAGMLFNYSYEIDVTTADASVGSTDLTYIRTSIEGYDWRHYAQRQFTLSFWVFSSKTGTHCVAFRNSGADRTYIAEYTVNAVDTWEYKTVIVTASPSAGTWNYTTGIGVTIYWVQMAGTTFHASAGAWQTGSGLATSNQVNVMDSTSNFFRLTGVKLEAGSVATQIEYIPFEEEYRRCLRYYQKSFQLSVTPAQNVGTIGSYQVSAPVTSTAIVTRSISLQAPMRISPSFLTFNPSAANDQPRNITDGVDDVSASPVPYERLWQLQFTPNAANTLGDVHAIHWIGHSDF